MEKVTCVGSKSREMATSLQNPLAVILAGLYYNAGMLSTIIFSRFTPRMIPIDLIIPKDDAVY